MITFVVRTFVSRATKDGTWKGSVTKTRSGRNDNISFTSAGSRFFISSSIGSSGGYRGGIVRFDWYSTNVLNQYGHINFNLSWNHVHVLDVSGDGSRVQERDRYVPIDVEVEKQVDRNLKNLKLQSCVVMQNAKNLAKFKNANILLQYAVNFC